MEFRRSYTAEIWAILLALLLPIIASVVLSMPANLVSDPADRSRDLSSRIDQAYLDEQPITASQAESKLKMVESILGSSSRTSASQSDTSSDSSSSTASDSNSETSSSTETSEEREARLQRYADIYNKQLKSRQSSIKARNSQRQEDNSEIVGILFVVGLIFAGLALISLLIKRCKPIALRLPDQAFIMDDSIFTSKRQLDYDQIGKIKYDIRIQTTHTGTDNHTSVTKIRKLYFQDRQGKRLDNFNLDSIGSGSFNLIQRYVAKRAPHIEWIYPD